MCSADLCNVFCLTLNHESIELLSFPKSPTCANLVIRSAAHRISNVLDCVFYSSVGLRISNGTVHRHCFAWQSLPSERQQRLDPSRRTAVSKFFDVVLESFRLSTGLRFLLPRQDVHGFLQWPDACSHNTVSLCLTPSN